MLCFSLAKYAFRLSSETGSCKCGEKISSFQDPGTPSRRKFVTDVLGEFVVSADCYVGLRRLGTKLVTGVEFIIFTASFPFESGCFPPFLI
jgi:hypothetical protein